MSKAQEAGTSGALREVVASLKRMADRADVEAEAREIVQRELIEEIVTGSRSDSNAG